MAGQHTAGIPRILRFAQADTAPDLESVRTLEGATIQLRIRSDVLIRVYFTEVDFVADANYVEVDTATDPAFELNIAAQVRFLWFRKPVAGTSNVEVVYTLK